MSETEVQTEFRAFHVEIEAQSIKGDQRIEFGSDGILFAPAIIINGHVVHFEEGARDSDYSGTGYAEITVSPFTTIRLVNVTDETFAALDTSMEENWMEETDTRESFSLPVSSLVIREVERVYRDRDSFMPLPI
jgi:hypothetical protein